MTRGVCALKMLEPRVDIPVRVSPLKNVPITPVFRRTPVSSMQGSWNGAPTAGPPEPLVTKFAATAVLGPVRGTLKLGWLRTAW